MKIEFTDDQIDDCNEVFDGAIAARFVSGSLHKAVDSFKNAVRYPGFGVGDYSFTMSQDRPGGFYNGFQIKRLGEESSEWRRHGGILYML